MTIMHFNCRWALRTETKGINLCFIARGQRKKGHHSASHDDVRACLYDDLSQPQPGLQYQIIWNRFPLYCMRQIAINLRHSFDHSACRSPTSGPIAPRYLAPIGVVIRITWDIEMSLSINCNRISHLLLRLLEVTSAKKEGKIKCNRTWLTIELNCD
jgi:hypothetical protein